MKQLTENRLGTKLVPDFCADPTPKEELDAYKARISRVTVFRDPVPDDLPKERALDDFMDGNGSF